MSSRVSWCLLLGLWAAAGPALAVNDIRVEGLFRGRAVLEIDGQRHLLSAGESSPEGVKLIAADSQHAVLEFNGQQRSYTLGTHISGTFQPPAPGATVTVAPDTQGMYRVDGGINGFQVGFIVDTGSTYVAMNSEQAKRIGINYSLEGEEGLSDTASGLDRIYIVKLDEVRVGDIVVHDVTGAVHEGDHPSVILLGNSFLDHVEIQRQGRLLQLTGKN